MPNAAISSTRKHTSTKPLTRRLQIATLMVVTPPIQQLDRRRCYPIPQMDAQAPDHASSITFATRLAERVAASIPQDMLSA